MIITDGLHLTSTIGEEELHSFARRIGLKREWYQTPAIHGHYDLTRPRALARAIELGAKAVSPGEFVRSAWWARFPRAGTQSSRRSQSR